ncbi:hypothetical protein TNCV_1458241 [Trichonephila clavipes]|nr:hypothetical protein TNCV_1458241 [Trichonephila clavipes]
MTGWVLLGTVGTNLKSETLTGAKVESMLESDEMATVIEEFVDFARQKDLEVGINEFQELMASHYQELTFDEFIYRQSKKRVLLESELERCVLKVKNCYALNNGNNTTRNNTTLNPLGSMSHVSEKNLQQNIKQQMDK